MNLWSMDTGGKDLTMHEVSKAAELIHSLAHDEANESRVGDRVVIEETRPLSREKRWRIRSIVSRVS
jgi:ribosomal protein S17